MQERRGNDRNKNREEIKKGRSVKRTKTKTAATGRNTGDQRTG
jgi:hypothetical protein